MTFVLDDRGRAVTLLASMTRTIVRSLIAWWRALLP